VSSAEHRRPEGRFPRGPDRHLRHGRDGGAGLLLPMAMGLLMPAMVLREPLQAVASNPAGCWSTEQERGNSHMGWVRPTPGRLIAVSLVAALAVLAACGDDEGESGAEVKEGSASFAAGTTMARLNEAGKVRVGTKFDQPLFGLKNLEGKPEGFDAEIAEIIAADLGISAENIEWIETISANREPFIQQDKVDFVVATYTINDKRKEAIDFAGPYYVAGQDIMVAKGNPEDITGPAALAGKKVCSVAGSTRRRTSGRTIRKRS
jgi:hypothetical protein